MASYTATAKIAIYDMDRTITRKPTYIPFLIHAAWLHNPLRLGLLPLIPVLSLLYLGGMISRTRLKEWCQHVLLGRAVKPVTIEAAALSFALLTVKGGVYSDALQRIRADRAEGCRLVMATASYEFYTTLIARQLGFDDVVATRSARDPQGRVLARVEGVNCFGEGKFAMVCNWMKAQGLDRACCDIRFYSDHISDQPLFEWSHHAFAINPDQRLATLAQARGWTILRWA